jgi:hypothetical protein
MLRHRRTPDHCKFLKQFDVKAIEVLREGNGGVPSHFFHGPLQRRRSTAEVEIVEREWATRHV